MQLGFRICLTNPRQFIVSYQRHVIHKTDRSNVHWPRHPHTINIDTNLQQSNVIIVKEFS
jgi:hypothetical protein